MKDEVVFEIRASWPRRLIAYATLLFIGGFGVYLAFSGAEISTTSKLLSIVAGCAALAFAEWFRRATAGVIRLTREDLRDADGNQLCRIEQIEKVDRGAFALKPNGGFVLRLSGGAPVQWAPGMWWRIGRSFGVGGVTDRHLSKAVAEYLALAVAERDKPKDDETP